MPVIEIITGIFVRMKGLEPPRLTAPDPKSGSATNYDTSAGGRKDSSFYFMPALLMLLHNPVPGQFQEPAHCKRLSRLRQEQLLHGQAIRKMFHR
jgi:hypothetical protein